MLRQWQNDGEVLIYIYFQWWDTNAMRIYGVEKFMVEKWFCN